MNSPRIRTEVLPVNTGADAMPGGACEGEGGGRSAEGRRGGPLASVRRSGRVHQRWGKPE
eukprot:6208433-Pleurochrysis_carterae.AAC.10